jgi:hypothetical protein
LETTNGNLPSPADDHAGRNWRTTMKTIQKISIADCDRGTDDDGNFTDDGFQYVVCEDNDIDLAIEYCDTLEEAERVLIESDSKRVPQ